MMIENRLTIPLDFEQTWQALCEDSGVKLIVCEVDGTVLFANKTAKAWLDWCCSEGLSEKRCKLFDDPTIPAGLLEERRELCERVCRENRAVVYESISWNIRYRITIRPMDLPDGRIAAMLVCRPMHPWERIAGGPPDGPEPVIVRHHDPGLIHKLSLRELEVLILIAEGLSYAEIADRLHRSVRTIERHRDRLGQKLGAHNRVQLARFAIRAGLAELPAPPDQAELARTGFDPLAVPDSVRRMADTRVRADA